MRLVTLLKMPGGEHEEGRPIKLTLRYNDGRVPSTREIDAVMLPVSEVDIHRIQRQAAAAAALEDAPLPESEEYAVRFLQASLRDAGDIGARLIEDENDLQALRVGLVGRQYTDLLEEYKTLMRTEYPDAPTKGDEEALRRGAEGFTSAPQGAPSSSSLPAP